MLVFLLRYIISLLFVLISGPFTEVLDARSTVRAVMSPKEVGRAVAIIFTVALPCDKGGRGFFTFAHDKLGAADANASCNKVEDIHSSYERTGTELITVESRLREVQPLIKNISNYHRLKPVYESYQRAKDKAAFRSSHEAELVIFEAARSTLLAIQEDAKLPSLKSLRAEQEQLTQEQQRLYEERANLKRQAKQIDTIRANVISYLNLSSEQEIQKAKDAQRE